MRSDSARVGDVEATSGTPRFDLTNASGQPGGDDDRFAMGVCYYPEQWPQDRWPLYARQIRDLGIRFVRIGEFTWSLIEPSPGCFDWSWLDQAVESLASEDLAVVFGTPTSAPPAWLSNAHPEILRWDLDGRRQKHGSRRHVDLASPIYRRQAKRITSEIALRYGGHAAVAGWQIDNELGDHETGRSWSPAALAGFRDWLSQRYESVEALNAAWGASFWSQTYATFDEVGLPNLTTAEPNPSQVLEFYRYSSNLITDFLAENSEIIRHHSPGRWITHNFMRLCDQFDHYTASQMLNFVSWDSYPTGGVEYSQLPDAEKIRWARVGEPDLIAFNHDLYRGMLSNRSFWVMEQQAGQINWAPFNPLPAKGAVSLWTTQAWAHGASCVSFFRWRAATTAQEALHSGLLRHDESLDLGGDELRAIPAIGHTVLARTNRVAVLHDYESLWIYDEQSHNANASYWEQMLLFYRALRSLAVDLDVLHVDADTSNYDVVIAPAIQLIDENRAARFTAVTEHAQLVVGPRTGLRTLSGRVHETGQPGPLRQLLGCQLLNFDSLRPGMGVTANRHQVEVWAECYRVNKGAAIASYDSGPLQGQAAVVRNRNATTIGAWSASLITAVLTDVLATGGIPTSRLPDGVRVTRTATHEVWCNFNDHPVEAGDGLRLEPVAAVVLDHGANDRAPIRTGG